MMGGKTALLLAACATLAACGGGGDGGSPAGGGPSATPTPTSTTLIAGAPTLVIGIAGSAQGSDYDTVKVAGRATLSGNLQLRFANGYRPMAGTRFVVLTADGGISGRFDAVNAEGIGFTIAYDANGVTITIA